jgi:hypothetical protein
MVNKVSFAVLTQEERAYILDSLTKSSYYEDWFGKLDEGHEEKLIISIFSKLQGF